MSPSIGTLMLLQLSSAVDDSPCPSEPSTRHNPRLMGGHGPPGADVPASQSGALVSMRSHTTPLGVRNLLALLWSTAA